MSQSYEFRQPDRFTVGTVGQPGQRVFYLQVGDLYDVVSVKLEKQQVAALAQFLEGLLADLPAPTDEVDPAPFNEPPHPDWVVGQIAVGVDEHQPESELVVVIEELVDDVDDDVDPDDPIDAILGGDEPSGATVRVHISIEQAIAFVNLSNELMTKGRPPCRLCGQPLDPTGHFCPRLN